MVKLFDYQRALPALENELNEAFRRVLHSGHLILGPETEKFETEFARWVGAKHCVAVSSGTAALSLSLRAIGVQAGDEVITVSNTCAPTISAILEAGGTPVFVDVEPDTLMMDVRAVEAAITPDTRCIIPVHLWGNSVNLDELAALSDSYKIAIVEDCAQATGTRYRGRHVGNFGAAGCFSFYPTKNLGCYGDGGAVITDDKSVEKRLRMLRVYGFDGTSVSMVEGVNARPSELQSAFLRVRLRKLDEDLARRTDNANRLARHLDATKVPATSAHTDHSYHQFVLRVARREYATELFDETGIQWAVHYETPTHVMPAFRNFSGPLPVTESAARHIISIPVHENLTTSEMDLICDALTRI
ncbi:DegT/DnrJ/EryC1/StrS family aminotransferase [Luminiphilus sp.]|nr:DegT/DnrJ/EryC1/StrS family aminotransferase [Luminiphilus sp.]